MHSVNSATCRYELSWVPPNGEKYAPMIFLRVHADFVRVHREVSSESPLIASYQKELKLGDFEHRLTDGFGFASGKLQGGYEKGEFLEFRVAIPPIDIPTGEPCPECNGTGKSDLALGQCLYCHGRRKKHEMHWGPANATAASLAMFFAMARGDEMQIRSVEPQLFEIWSSVGERSCPLSGWFGAEFMTWLAGFEQGTHFREAEEAMWQAYSYMFHDRDRKMWMPEIRAHLLHPGYLSLGCPGDRCGIFPSNHGNQVGKPCEFHDHNLDTCAQQLSLLVGLAAMHDLARKEMRADKKVKVV